jgi:hypothetical protein
MSTLEIMLECISSLQSGVDLRAILTSFMDRLSSFVRDHPEAVPADLHIFDLFHGYIAKISKDPSISLATMLALQVTRPAAPATRHWHSSAARAGRAPQLLPVSVGRPRGPGAFRSPSPSSAEL